MKVKVKRICVHCSCINWGMPLSNLFNSHLFMEKLHEKIMILFMFGPHEFLTNTCYSYITILLLSFLQYHDSSWIFNENWGKASVDLKNILIKQEDKRNCSEVHQWNGRRSLVLGWGCWWRRSCRKDSRADGIWIGFESIQWINSLHIGMELHGSLLVTQSHTAEHDEGRRSRDVRWAWRDKQGGDRLWDKLSI